MELARVLLVFVRGKVSKSGDAVAVMFVKRTYKNCKLLSRQPLAAIKAIIIRSGVICQIV